MDPMAVLLDVAVVAVLVFFVWRGWHKGLLLSLCGLAVALVAFFGAGFLADTLDDPVANAIQPKLAQAIEENVHAYMETHFDPSAPIGDPENAKVNMWDGMREMGGFYAWCADSVEDSINHISRHMDPSEMFAIAANQVATQLAHRVLFLVSFVILAILCTLLLHALDLVAKLPVLHTFNELGGGIIGLGKAVIVLFVLTCFLPMAAQWVPAEAVEETKILSVFVSINPVLTLFH